ncbi:Regulator of chromosome condensation (RCC1) repeat [Carpediemonas membranifera]|uniref:Regulator of chromosome condensation (RCC1) repeat n=1 Tax=Carpediemonas membranifera TaxID=201153 RepID=A0A8J6E308_9EUKA|nr:Regulator of chromosome condensation (RCC1) repeat [Carpediemonas membranifera]|eukprot:KAG9394991.1 Regulator of chromosome condensation (RCC1) repeat [Carpediemonas membranifera]
MQDTTRGSNEHELEHGQHNQTEPRTDLRFCHDSAVDALNTLHRTTQSLSHLYTAPEPADDIIEAVTHISSAAQELVLYIERTSGLIASVQNSLLDIGAELVPLLDVSLEVTETLPGDIPRILRSIIHDIERSTCRHIVPHPVTMLDIVGLAEGLDRVRARLADIRPSTARADRALRNTVDDGTRRLGVVLQSLAGRPALSMGIPIHDAPLPERLYTLLQGTLFAALVAGGASPELERGSPANGFFFLCKKFYFVQQVASREAIPWDGSYASYNGRLFHMEYVPDSEQTLEDLVAWSWQRMPPIHRIHVEEGVTVGISALGLYAWGNNSHGQLGLGLTDPTVTRPSRVSFPDCDDVAEYEASLPCWHKDELAIDVKMTGDMVFVRTPVGVVGAGRNTGGALGVGIPQSTVRTMCIPTFRMVPLPITFTLTSLETTDDGPDPVLTLCQGRRRLVCGTNAFGCLGLGHSSRLSVFAELPFPVADMYSNGIFSFFHSAGRILVAGRLTGLPLPREIAGYTGLQPIELPFPWPITHFGGDFHSFLYCRRENGMWYAIGANSTGALGVWGEAVADWVQVPLRGITEIMSTGTQTYFRTSDGLFAAGLADGLGIDETDETVVIPTGTYGGIVPHPAPVVRDVALPLPLLMWDMRAHREVARGVNE